MVLETSSRFVALSLLQAKLASDLRPVLPPSVTAGEQHHTCVELTFIEHLVLQNNANAIVHPAIP